VTRHRTARLAPEAELVPALEEQAGRDAEKVGVVSTSTAIIFSPWRKNSSRLLRDQTASVPPSVEICRTSPGPENGWTYMARH
jgi:hypothetical protein